MVPITQGINLVCFIFSKKGVYFLYTQRKMFCTDFVVAVTAVSFECSTLIIHEHTLNKTCKGIKQVDVYKKQNFEQTEHHSEFMDHYTTSVVKSICIRKDVISLHCHFCRCLSKIIYLVKKETSHSLLLFISRVKMYMHYTQLTTSQRQLMIQVSNMCSKTEVCAFI